MTAHPQYREKISARAPDQRLLGRDWRRALAQTIIAFLLFYWDPLGIALQKNRGWTDLFAAITQYAAPSTTSMRLAVVLIDEDTLKFWGEDWPITYQRTSELIHALACAHVRGIFFDYTPSAAFNLALGKSLLEQELSGAGGNESTPQCPKGGRQPSVDVFMGKIAGMVWHLSDRLAGSAFALESGSDDDLYPAFSSLPYDRRTASNRTPAFGILQKLPDLAVIPTHDDGSLCGRFDMRARCWNDPIRLEWATDLDSNQPLATSTVGCRGNVSFLKMMFNLLGLIAEDRYQSCPPILTLNALDLFRDAAFLASHGDPARTISNRFVLVGTHLPGLNDFVYSPWHGYLPGVYKHAMALDNLIVRGATYDTIPRPWVLLSLVLALYGIIEASREYTQEHRWEVWIGRGAIAMAFAVFATIVKLWHWPMSLLIAVFSYCLGWRWIAQWFGRILKRLDGWFFSLGRTDRRR
jgi:hypothetical protein